MKFVSGSAFLIVAFAAVVQAGVPALVARSPAVAAPVAARAEEVCNPSACLCNGVPGLFCGDESINPDCFDDDVYQCNESGATCDFGFRNSCHDCHALSC